MKTYTMVFGSGDPRTLTGLSPTFLFFVNTASGATVAPPSITEVLTGMGVYQFSWGTTQPIAFLADAATTSPGAQGRYIVGDLDPVDAVNEVGTTLTALVGTVGSTFGGTGTDPIDLFGYLKRLQENFEGDETFGKTTGVLQILNRGSSTVLRNKTITNGSSAVTKTGVS